MSLQPPSGFPLTPGNLKARSDRERAPNWDAQVLGLLEQILEQLQLQTAQHEAQQFRPSTANASWHDRSVSVSTSTPSFGHPMPSCGDSGADVEGEAEEATGRTATTTSMTMRSDRLRAPSARTINRIARTSQQADLDEVLGSVMQLLFIAAVLPTKAASPGWRRRGYKLYRILLVAAWVLAGIRYMRDFIVPPALFGRAPIMTTMVVTVIHFFMALPFWHVWRKNFAADARLMRFFQQMAHQNFPWTTLRPSIRLLWATAAVAALANLLYTLSYTLSGEMWFMLMEPGDRHFSAVRALDILGDTAGAAASVLWVLVTLIHTWSVYFVCRLHQHDLLCYASAVRREIESVTGTSATQDTVHALRELEARTTTRLHHASQTWVRFVALVTCGLSTGFLVTCLHLLSEPRRNAAVLGVDSVVSAFLLIISASLASPLALTAETFEHDVLRALNTPLVMERSQRLFGQQFLNHLVLLQWGFRFGGSVITVSMVRNIVGALFVTMVTSVSRAFIARANLL